MTRAPYRPRHRRSQAAHGLLSRLAGLSHHRLSPSDTVFAVLSLAVLLLVALCLGALMARPL